MEKASSSGAMVSSTRVNSQITELPAMAFIDGLTEAFMKARSKTDSGMGLENTRSKKPPMKANGSRVKSLAKVKSFSRVEVFSKDPSKTISSKGTEKCTTILQETIFKANGRMTRRKVKERWIGPTLDKNTSENGKTTINKAGACTFGSSPKVKESTFVTGTKDIGSTVLDKATVSFTMRMAPGTKAIGRTTWRKDSLFTQMKMGKLSSFFSRKTEWFVKIIQPLSRSQMVRKLFLKNKLSRTFTLCAWRLIHFTTPTLQILSFFTIIFWEATLPWRAGTKASQPFMINSLNTVSA